MLLNKDKSQVLIVDVQERLVPVMNNAELLVRNCEVLAQSASELGIPITVSEHYSKGLGPTVDRLNDAINPNEENAFVMDKLHFSCAADPDILFHVASLAENGRRQLIIAGVESHVCVLQSALGFKQAGLDVYVAIDATSSRDKNSKSVAKDRLNNSSITVVTLEMIVFEWLHISGTSEFKKLSQLVK